MCILWKGNILPHNQNIRTIASAIRIAVVVLAVLSIPVSVVIIMVNYGFISSGAGAPVTDPFEKIASAIATPPEPVGDRWPWRLLWYLYPWQTFIAAILAGGSALYAGQQAYRSAMIPVKHASKQEYRQIRREKMALLHALASAAKVIIQQVQAAQIVILLAKENNMKGNDLISMIIIRMPSTFPSNWSDYKSVSEKITEASFSLLSSVEISLLAIKEYGGYALKESELNDGFTVAVLLELQKVGVAANLLLNIVERELNGNNAEN